MSYDLHLFRPESGVEPLETVERLLDADEETDEINPGLPVPEKEESKRALAQALINLNPQLEIFEFGFKEIAEMEGITQDEAHIKFRHLELNGAEDGNGIQITLSDDTADITVPYWHTGDAAKQTFEEIWSYLKLLEAEGGFVTYDPQLEQILNLATDISSVLQTYEEVSGNM